MRKIVLVSLALLMFLCGACVFAQGASYKIENPEYLEKGSVTVETKWDFYWGKFVDPSDKVTSSHIAAVPNLSGVNESI